MSETLEKLFGSRSRLRVMRLFLLQSDTLLTVPEIATRVHGQTPAVRKDVTMLTKIGLLQEQKKQKKKYYTLAPTFPYRAELYNLFLKANTYPQCSELDRFAKVRGVKAVVVSGVFMNHTTARLDLLIVGNDLIPSELKRIVRVIEAEVGNDVRYMALSVDDFLYRLDMMDRFLIEFLSGPHDVILNDMPKLSAFLATLAS